MGYVTDQKSQIHSECGLMMPRLKAFGMALTGDEAKTQSLLRTTHQHLLSRAAKERGHTPMAIWAFLQLQRIWSSRMKGKSADQADPRVFQPRSRANDGGASARFAMRLAKLSPTQRGILHLVYGERLSYDEVAEIFDAQISDIISLLAKSYAALGEMAGQETGASSAHEQTARTQEAPTQQRQGQAA